MIDNIIARILNAALKSVEGVTSSTPCFKEKQQIVAEIKHLKAVIRKRKGGRVNENENSELKVENMTLEKMQEKYQRANQQWKE